MLPSDDDFASIRRQFPTLDKFGFQKKPATAARFDGLSVALCKAFFTRYCKSTKKVRAWSSYGWKHIIENAMGCYIANGDCIAGAVLAGFRIIPDDDGPNCRFALSVANPAVKEWIHLGQPTGDVATPFRDEINGLIDASLLS